MRKYDETTLKVADRVLKRSDEIIRQRQIKATKIRHVSYAVSGLCAAVILCFGIMNLGKYAKEPNTNFNNNYQTPSSNISIENETTTTSTNTVTKAVNTTSTSSTETATSAKTSDTTTTSADTSETVTTSDTEVTSVQTQPTEPSINTTEATENATTKVTTKITTRITTKTTTRHTTKTTTRHTTKTTTRLTTQTTTRLTTKTTSKTTTATKPVTTTVTTTKPVVQPTEYGDVNGDGKPDIEDAVLIVAYVNQKGEKTWAEFCEQQPSITISAEQALANADVYKPSDKREITIEDAEAIEGYVYAMNPLPTNKL